jgi:membrane associated rhomboid family serine protease
MGIYDRDYYRREGPSFLGSLVDRGQVCKWLLAINITFFVLQTFTRERVRIPHPDGGPDIRLPFVVREPFTDALILDCPKVMQGEVWRLLTCAFLHGGIWHLVFNMLFLWWFGREMEELYGSVEFLAFYLLAAVVASLAYVAAWSAGLQGGRALGASGAIMAVTVLFAFHYPRHVIYLFFVIPMPVWGFVVLIVAADFLNLFGRSAHGIGQAAHLGGAAFGFVYYRLHWRLTGVLGDVRNWFARRRQPRLRVYREEARRTPVGVATPNVPAVASDLDKLREEMDAILEKISLVGKDNLTEQERAILQRASEVFKRRRN